MDINRLTDLVGEGIDLRRESWPLSCPAASHHTLLVGGEDLVKESAASHHTLLVGGVRVSVGCFTPYRQLGSFSRRKQVWAYSVLVENKFGIFQSWVIESMR